MLIRAMAKELSAGSAHECLFVDFLSEEEPKKIKQSERGISINEEKYVKDLLKKYDINGSSLKTPMIKVAKGVSYSKRDIGSQTGHSIKETQSNSAKDTNPSQPPASTHVVAGMHTESAVGHDASATSTAEADPGKTNPNDSVSQQQATGKGASYIEKEIEYVEEEFNTSPNLSSSDDTKKEIKLEDLSKLVLNLDVGFINLDSLEDDQPIIVEDEEKEESQNSKLKKEKIKAKVEISLLSAQPTYPNMEQLIELLVKSLSPELLKLLSSHDFSSSLSTKIKELPSKFNDLTREIKKLKKHVHELPLKSSPQPEGELIKKDKEQKRIEESVKADLAKQEVELGKEELVYLLGIDVVKGFYKAKLQYDKDCDKMLNRRV
ncbi:hypothetical protein Tco_0127479 [Tanacetum coccineum]